jgi:hypothetical protein
MEILFYCVAAWMLGILTLWGVLWLGRTPEREPKENDPLRRAQLDQIYGPGASASMPIE